MRPGPRGLSQLSVPGSHAGLAVVAFVAVVWILIAQGLGALDTSQRDLLDTDGYMRTTRVVDLVSGENGWFDGSAHRSNAPFGHTMHWTRPMDALIGGAAGPAILVGVADVDAVYWASVLAGPLMMLGIGLAVVWAAVPLVGKTAAFLAGAIAAAQPAITAYTMPGRSDHHGLILLSAAIAMGATLRMLVGSDNRRSTWLGGLAIGVGIWVSVESLFVVAVVGIGLAVAWIAGRVDGIAVRTLWTVAAGVAVGAWVIERGTDLRAVEYDRISFPYVLALLMAAAIWWAAVTIGNGRSARARWFIIGAPAASALLLLGFAYPGLLDGPFASVPAELRERWLDRVVELQRLVDLSPGLGVAFAAVPVLGVVAGIVIARRRSGDAAGWWFLVFWVLAGLALAWFQARWVSYPQLAAAIPVAAAVEALLTRLGRRGRLVRLLGSPVVILVGVFGWLALGALAPADETSVESSENCTVGELVRVSQLGLVLASVDSGPEILWRTDASVVGAPYHRNVGGILDTLDAFEGDERVARGIVEGRGVDHVVVCPGIDAREYPQASADSLYTRLVGGRPPEWLEPVPGDAGGFLVYRVAG